MFIIFVETKHKLTIDIKRLRTCTFKSKAIIDMEHLEKIKKLAKTKNTDVNFCNKIASEIFISWIIQKTNKGEDLDVIETQELAEASYAYANIFIEMMVCNDQEIISYLKTT
jgi:hypothetical protein